MQPASTYRVADLGEPISEHRFSMGRQVRVLALLFVGAPVLLVLLAATGVMPLGNDWGALEYGSAALFFLGLPGIGAKLWLEARTRGADFVRTHERGIAYVSQGKPGFIAWADVESLTCEVKQRATNGIPGAVTRRYVIAARGGTTTTVTHGYERIEELAELLLEKTSEVIDPRVEDALLAKKEVAFGLLYLSAEYLRHGEKKIPIQNVALRTDNGWIKVESDGAPFCDVPVSEVANAHLLATLVDRMRALHS